MTGFWALDYLLLALMLAAAVLVVRLRNLNGAVMALSAVGTMLSVLFVVLGAPDVAHSKVVVGAIALPVFTWWLSASPAATYRTSRSWIRPGSAAMSQAEPPRRRPETFEHEPGARRWLGALLAAGMMVALGAAVVSIPREHAALPAVARYAMAVALPRWGLTEPAPTPCCRTSA